VRGVGSPAGHVSQEGIVNKAGHSASGV
jgi:hypothetical protein